MLTGLRLGESAMRDGKLKRSSCAAGGECGIPDPSNRTYSPILNWSVCQVIDWLNGIAMPKKETRKIDDLITITRRLVEIYAVRIGQSGLTFDEGSVEPEVRTSRYGCNGCPAIQSESHAPISAIRQHGGESPMNEIYDVWYEARRKENRCGQWRKKYIKAKTKNGKKCRKWKGLWRFVFGPIKMHVRPILFERVMDIQRRAGIVLVTPEDEAFIRDCWANKVYPRGWGPDDELTVPPSDTPLFDHEE